MVRRGVVIWSEFLPSIYAINSYYKNIESKSNYKNEKKKNSFKLVLGIFVFLTKIYMYFKPYLAPSKTMTIFHMIVKYKKIILNVFISRICYCCDKNLEIYNYSCLKSLLHVIRLFFFFLLRLI